MASLLLMCILSLSLPAPHSSTLGSTIQSERAASYSYPECHQWKQEGFLRQSPASLRVTATGSLDLVEQLALLSIPTQGAVSLRSSAKDWLEFASCTPWPPCPRGPAHLFHPGCWEASRQRAYPRGRDRAACLNA